jgi:hypothetical protein
VGVPIKGSATPRSFHWTVLQICSASSSVELRIECEFRWRRTLVHLGLSYFHDDRAIFRRRSLDLLGHGGFTFRSAAGSAARAGIPKTIAAVAPNLNAIPAAGARIIGFMGQNMSAWQMSNISKATIAIRTVTILSRRPETVIHPVSILSFRKHGVEYYYSDRTTSDYFGGLLPILNSRRCRLLDNKRLASQLCSLERRPSRIGAKDSISHPPGSHDDCAAAVAGLMVRMIGVRDYTPKSFQFRLSTHTRLAPT